MHTYRIQCHLPARQGVSPLLQSPPVRLWGQVTSGVTGGSSASAGRWFGYGLNLSE